MNKLELRATEERQRINASVEAVRQEEKDTRERAQEACDNCGGPTERKRIVISSEGDTTVELTCRWCGWRC